MHMRQPKPHLGRDFARQLKLFMSNFHGVDALASFPWCDGSMTISRSLSETSAAFEPFPKVLASQSRDDYVDGYSDALAVIRGLPLPTTTLDSSHSPLTSSVEALSTIPTTLQNSAPRFGGRPELLALLGTMLL